MENNEIMEATTDTPVEEVTDYGSILYKAVGGLIIGAACYVAWRFVVKPIACKVTEKIAKKKALKEEVVEEDYEEDDE